MRILIISTIMLIPWLAGPTSAASISGINPGSNGVCAPSEREWTPCGSDFASTPSSNSQDRQMRHLQHTSDQSGIGADRREGIHGGRADGNRGGGNGSGHGGGHQSDHGGGGRR